MEAFSVLPHSHQFCVGDSGNFDSSNAPSLCVLFNAESAFRLSPCRPMTSNESKNEMLVMVLTDLAGIYKKLAENSAVPENMRVEARKFVEEFGSLAPYRGKGTAAQHAQGEMLLAKMARFLPELLAIRALPRSNVGD
jgi:hypothetical protein